jgi:hypothetical protein
MNKEKTKDRGIQLVGLGNPVICPKSSPYTNSKALLAPLFTHEPVEFQATS